jgi:poly(3-hydroxybutyrate) depolymerase
MMLVIDFHGYYSTEFDEEQFSGLVAGSDDDNYIVIFPHGGGDSGEIQSWNAVGTTEQETKEYGKTCNTNRGQWGYYDCYNSCIKTVGCQQKTSCLCSSCYDDRYFVKHILEDILHELCIDEAHIHGTGLSNGGMMAYEVGTHLSTYFASIAPTASAPLLGFNVGPTEEPVSILDFHGTADNIIPGNVSQSYRGNVAPHGATFSSDGFYYTAIPDVMKVWAGVNKCGGNSPIPVKWPTAYDGVKGMSCVEPYGGCTTGARVIQCVGTWGHTNVFDFWTPKMFPSVAYQFFAMTPKVGKDAPPQYTYKGMRGKSLEAPELTISRSNETTVQRTLREKRQAHRSSWLSKLPAHRT